jgi:hypothetical protein
MHVSTPFFSDPQCVVVQVVGRCGEGISNAPVSLTFKHWAYKNALRREARTDKAGCLSLGPLKGIQAITLCALIPLRCIRNPKFKFKLSAASPGGPSTWFQCLSVCMNQELCVHTHACVTRMHPRSCRYAGRPFFVTTVRIF